MKFIIIISFIDFYSEFSVFVTNTVILLEPCCGTITEAGLPGRPFLIHSVTFQLYRIWKGV